MSEKSKKSDKKFYDKFLKPVKVKHEKRKNEKLLEEKEKHSDKNSNKSAEKKFSKKNSTEKNTNAKNTNLSTVKFGDSLFDFANVPIEAKRIVNNFDKILDDVTRLNSKQKAMLYHQIKMLSHTLTDSRDERRVGYMNETTTITSYAYYYMWWNLVRLTRLFANLPASFFALEDNDICLDIGSGPLTVVTALFLSRPELRNKKLTFYCMDLSREVLAFGENVFLSVAARLECEPWKIVRVKGEMGTGLKEKASLIACANVFNESTEKYNLNEHEAVCEKYVNLILSYTDSSRAKVLVVEPGVPKNGKLISSMRKSFIEKGFVPVSPCPHCEECVMTRKEINESKWCNFSFETDNAPEALLKLSEKAELNKTRAVLSFIAVEKNIKTQNDESDEKKILSFRIVSDAIRLPGNRQGFYACSEIGLLLVVTAMHLYSGQKCECEITETNFRIDYKSKAKIITL